MGRLLRGEEVRDCVPRCRTALAMEQTWKDPGKGEWQVGPSLAWKRIQPGQKRGKKLALSKKQITEGLNNPAEW